jgi:hypothetical protein
MQEHSTIRREHGRLLGVLLSVVMINCTAVSGVRAQPAGEPIPTIDTLETDDTSTPARGDPPGGLATVETQRPDPHTDVQIDAA